VTFLSHSVEVRWIVLLAAIAACSGAPRPTPWQVVAGDPVLYLYPEVIERYAPEDRGGYVVHPPQGADAAARAALIASLDPADPDDIVGDGIVVRLDAAARDRLGARAEILQPAARRGPRPDPADVRVDLFADAPDAERDAVARWLEARGATVRWRGPAALRARVPAAVIEEVARLGPVRWVE
jgi:hypothetical protein